MFEYNTSYIDIPVYNFTLFDVKTGNTHAIFKSLFKFIQIEEQLNKSKI